MSGVKCWSTVVELSLSVQGCACASVSLRACACVCLPAVGGSDEVGGCEEPVEQVQASSFLPSNQCLALAFLPAVAVRSWRGSLQPGNTHKQQRSLSDAKVVLLACAEIHQLSKKDIR